jgi:predicted alpha/beta hydrolase
MSTHPTVPPAAAPEPIRVTTSDGAGFVVRVLPHEDPAAPVVLILPAMALKAKFYLPLARALHAAGVSAATVDLRAQGESTPTLGEAANFGYRELVETDLPAVVAALAERFPDSPVHLFGHSLGGQLALLFAAANPDRVAGVTVLGTGSVYWRAFPARRWIEILFRTQVVGVVSKVRGIWPGWRVFPGRMAGGVMVDWARHARTGRYRPRGRTRDYDELLRELKLPVLAISLDRDPLGPKSNVDFLCGRMPSAQPARWHLVEGSGVANLDHFAWIKDSAVIGASVAGWVTEGRLPG